MSFEVSAALAAKAAALKIGLGMVGAALLYLFMPPERPDGSFNPKEFAARMAVAGFFSCLCGSWFVAVIDGLAPWLLASKYPEPFWLACGAPGWWVSRAAALWIYNRRAKDLGEVAKDLKPGL